ncbi:retrovirus-related pol polyprotein from transposon TNT 1-94 [Tanacetum coccineum]
MVDPTSSNLARPVLTNARLAVEVFDGTGHFSMWQSEVLDALFQQGLDIVVEESKPEDVEERNWLTINRLACGTIRSCLSREQRYAFSKETSAYKLWVTLEEKFLKKNCQNKLFMKSFNQLVTNLMNMDEVFKDQDLALILLGSLPEEYGLLETTLLNGKDDVSLSKVCTALYSKELRRKDKQISSSRDAEVCYPAATRVHIHCDDEESDLSLVTSSSRNDSEIWQLDSACSHHITPHREWFSNFEEHEEVVYTADETPLTTHGIGSIRLQNEDGTIVTLKGVRYSSKLNKNLIFVGTLESKGFEVRAKCGVMKIISGVLVVMKGIRKINNTYHYKGRTVAGTVAAVTDGDYEEEEVQAEEPRQQQHESIDTSKPKRNTKRHARLNDKVACASSIAADDIPTTYSEEMGKKAIGYKWVYAKKERFSGQDDVRYKARLVAKGYAQKDGIDYNKVFSLVVKHPSIRILLATVAQLDLELVQMDVKTAFLHGDLEKEIYMVQPEGFKVARKEHEVCKLHKSLYGLKQSPRQWYKQFNKFMMESKYKRSKYDHCVYLKKLQDGSFVYLILYVDDMLIASQSSDEIEKLKTRLKNEFEMKDLGEAKMILSMENMSETEN